MSVIKNIIAKSHPIPDDTVKLCKQLGIFEHLPVEIPKDISFELHNTTTEMANALRRCINSEIEVLTMTFGDADVRSDDNFIIIHELKKRINLIPIRQISGVVFQLDVSNNTDIIIPVYSSSIIETNKKIKEKIFSGTFILTYLRPGKFLQINNIHVQSGVAYKNGAEFSFPGKVKYKCLDLENVDIGEKNTSSMVAEPTTYKLTVPRQKFIDPVQIIKMALKTLDNKVVKIKKILEDNVDNFYSSEMEIIYTKNSALFKIYGETYTIGNLLIRYGLDADKTITNIHCIHPHPSFDYINIKITHADPRKIMLMSIAAIQKELKNIGSEF